MKLPLPWTMMIMMMMIMIRAKLNKNSLRNTKELAAMDNSHLGPCSTLRPLFIPHRRILWEDYTFPELLQSCEYCSFCYLYQCCSYISQCYKKDYSLGKNNSKIVVETF